MFLPKPRSYFVLILGWIFLYSPIAFAQENAYPDRYENPCDRDLFDQAAARLKAPTVVRNLGRAPQFDFLRNINSAEEFYSSMMIYSNANARVSDRDRQELYNLLVCLGYENGFNDSALSANSFRKVTLAGGTTGMLGSNDHSYTHSVILNEQNKGVIDAWQVESPSGKNLYFMSDCGNAFVPAFSAARYGVPCDSCPPCPEPCNEDQFISLNRTDRFVLDDENTIDTTIAVPVFAQKGCCRGVRDSSLQDTIGFATFDIQVQGRSHLDQTIPLSMAATQDSTCKDSLLVDLGDGLTHQLASNIELSVNHPEIEGLVLPGLAVIPYNDNILRLSVGTEFGNPSHEERDIITNEVIRRTDYEPMFNIALGIEKYLDNCFFIALDGIYGRKNLNEVIFGPRRNTEVDVPNPLNFWGLSPTLLYDLRNCREGLKVGVGPHLYVGSSTSDQATDADLSYSALGAHAELALLITERIELFVQGGFNNHKYRNQNTTQFESRLGAKYIFSPDKRELKTLKPRRNKKQNAVPVTDLNN